MEKIVNILTMTAAVLTVAIAAYAQKAPELRPVNSVDLDRYAGRWYEIAKYPNKFQKNCVANTTATYTRKPDGKIEVVNECLEKDGTAKTAKGEAKIVDKATNAKLKVRFAPDWLSFMPFVWGDYWVIDLGADYEYAVVAEPKREYLWILSRTPRMGEGKYRAILKKVEDIGFVPARLQQTPQNAAAGRGTVANSE